MPRKPFKERLLEKINVDGPVPEHCPELGPCHVWTGSTNGRYGQLWKNSKIVYAHREIYALRHGPIPKKKQVLHKCDNPLCLRDSHHFLGTHRDNMKDRDRKGRCRATGNPGKLKPEQVREVRALYSQGDITQEELARRFHVSQPTIHDVISLKSYANLL